MTAAPSLIESSLLSEGSSYMHRVPRRILVTDGEQRAALAVVRSLGRLGHEVYVCSTTAATLAGASRYCCAEMGVNDPLRNPTGFLTDVEAIVRRYEIEVLLPIAEPALLALLPERARFPETILPFPNADLFKRSCDKGYVAHVASGVGIAVPKQIQAHEPVDAYGPEIDALGFPIVLKPIRSIMSSAHGLEKVAVRYAVDRHDLQRQLRELGPDSYPLLLQQRVSGPGVGIFLLRWNGTTRACFAHRRLVEKPPSGGVSVYRESISAPEALMARSEALLAALDWQGVAMIEYKVDAESDSPYLMEINGRFWGSLQLAIDAGVDFPRLLLECAENRAPSAAASYAAGVRSRWFWGTVDHLIARRHRYSDPGPPLSRVVGDLLAFWKRNDREEVLRLDDPRPFIRETLQWMSHARAPRVAL